MSTNDCRIEGGYFELVIGVAATGRLQIFPAQKSREIFVNSKFKLMHDKNYGRFGFWLAYYN